jgi:hypothetical protein
MLVVPPMNKQQSFKRKRSLMTKGPRLIMLDSPDKPTETKLDKEIIYKDPKVRVGNGKLGPVDLIIIEDELFALKRIPKAMIDKDKRIQHIKSEKSVLLMLK